MSKHKKGQEATQLKDGGYHCSSTNPGLVMGRSICFAKFTHNEGYQLINETEPSWMNKDNIWYSSVELYHKYLNWLESR